MLDVAKTHSYAYSIRRKAYWEKTAGKSTSEMRGRSKEWCENVRRRGGSEGYMHRIEKIEDISKGCICRDDPSGRVYRRERNPWVGICSYFANETRAAARQRKHAILALALPRTHILLLYIYITASSLRSVHNIIIIIIIFCYTYSVHCGECV